MIEHVANVNRYDRRKPVGPWSPRPEQDAVAGLQLLQDAVVAAGPELLVDERLQALAEVLALQDGVDVCAVVPYDSGGLAGQPLLTRDDPGLAEELRPLLQLPGADVAAEQESSPVRDRVGVTCRAGTV